MVEIEMLKIDYVTINNILSMRDMATEESIHCWQTYYPMTLMTGCFLCRPDMGLSERPRELIVRTDWLEEFLCNGTDLHLGQWGSLA